MFTPRNPNRPNIPPLATGGIERDTFAEALAESVSARALQNAALHTRSDQATAVATARVYAGEFGRKLVQAERETKELRAALEEANRRAAELRRQRDADSQKTAEALASAKRSGAQLVLAEQEIKDLKKQLEGLEELKRKLKAAEALSAQQAGTIAKNSATIADLRDQHQKDLSALAKVQQAAALLKEELEKNNTALLAAQALNKDTTALEGENKRLAGELTASLERETGLRQVIETQRQKILELEAEVARLNSLLAKQAAELESAMETIDTLSAALHTAEAERAAVITERDQARLDRQTKADQLATVTGKVDGLTAEVAILTTEKDRANAEVARLTTALEGHAETSAELEVAKREVARLQSDLDKKSTELSSAAAQIVALGAEVEKLNGIIREKDTKISELEGKIAQLSAENAQLREQLRAQDLAIAELGVSVEAAKSEAKTAKDEQKTAEATLATVRREMGAALANATKTIGVLESDIETLKTNAAENAAELLVKQGELDRAQSTASDLQSQLSTAEAAVTRETTRADELALKAETLQGELNSALAENARLKVDIKKLTVQASALQSTVYEITRQNEAVNTALQAALLGSQQLTSDLDLATASIASLTQKLVAEGADQAATQLLLDQAIENKRGLEGKLGNQQLLVKSLEGQVGVLSRQLSSKTRECGKLRELVIAHKKMLSEQTRKRELAEADLLKSQALLKSTTVAKDALAVQLGETEEKLAAANAQMLLMEQKHLAEIAALDTKVEGYQKQLDALKAEHLASINGIQLELLAVTLEKESILAKLMVAQETIAGLRQESQELRTELSTTKQALESTKKALSDTISEVEKSTNLLRESEKGREEAERVARLAEEATRKAEAETRQVTEEKLALQKVVTDAQAVVSRKDVELEAVKLELLNVTGKSDLEIEGLREKQTLIQRELEESRRREEDSQKRLQDFERQARILRAQKAIIAAHKQTRAIYDVQLSLRENIQGSLMTTQYDLETTNSGTLEEKIKRDQEYQRQLQTILKIKNITIRMSLLKNLRETDRISREAHGSFSSQQDVHQENKQARAETTADRRRPQNAIS